MKKDYSSEDMEHFNMENSYEALNKVNSDKPDLQIMRYSSYHPCSKLSLAWLDIRVFYVRISNFVVDDSTPECLTLNHIPLNPDTLFEVNGTRCTINSEGASCLLKRDRIGKKSEEATFVSTDCIRLTGNVKFEVFDHDDCVLSGVLEISNSNGTTGESKNNARRWSMKCESVMNAGTGFLKGKQVVGSEPSSPTVEVYVAGCFAGTPIILNKTLQLNRKKHNRKGMLNSIPEYETPECQKDVASGLDLQPAAHLFGGLTTSALRLVSCTCGAHFLLSVSGHFSRGLVGSKALSPGRDPIALQVPEYVNYKTESEEEYNSMYWRQAEYLECEDGELSWFNAGVRVGVGIGLGICLGVGIGVGRDPIALQVPEYVNYKTESEEEYNSMYWRQAEYLECEDGELSWFNAGVRVGVGIGLGICLGVGIGVGLLVRTYQSTTRNFKRRLL
ncbi:hypothetical protein RJ639_039589 [Escallonia herrerae]|uniref:Erythronate-4-phosphate dehydrogenase family protein n=1 Tax=Escallonia herrerae TaxID=1293975 RepID=A0AA88WQ07_9ASTE|nr:hypothetical protein RJ639_039589 [Escallonia herrerae]